jgi:hypothetical protein
MQEKARVWDLLPPDGGEPVVSEVLFGVDAGGRLERDPVRYKLWLGAWEPTPLRADGQPGWKRT